jgi:uncharacterized membrane protein HdeD (DUF308 family)
MKINNPILLFFVLPTLAPLLLPPDTLLSGLGAVAFAAALLLLTGYFVSRGRSLALTFIIFLLGLNFVVRLMLFFSTAISAQGVANWPFIITSLLSMIISIYLVFRLDQVDIRAQMRS